MALGIGAALNFLTRAIAVNSLRGKKDDGLGDQENRKRLAARAFLEGYEPDKRLFARGPVDDAPDVVVPEPLTEPVTNILPEQQRVIPQLVAPGVAGIAPGEEDTFILQEINRLDRNILAIAQSMEENAKIDAEYRASVIQQQREQLAKRGQARSRRRSERRKGFFGSLKEQAEQKRNALVNRFRNVRNELGKGFAGYSALLALAEAKKREDDIKEFFENVGNIPEEIKKLLEGNIATQDYGLGQADPANTGQLNLPQSELQQKVLKRVYGPESQGSYNAMNQGTIKNAKGEDVIVGSTLDSKTILGENLTDMTFGEVLKRQKFLMDPLNPQESDYGVFAAGAAQVAPNTLEGAMRRAGLTETDMFSPENQDRVTLQLIKERGIQPWTSGGSKYSDETKRMVEELRRLLNQPKSNPLGNQSFVPSSPVTPVSYSPSVAAMPMGEMSEILEPFIVDQRSKEQEPVVTGVRGGSQEVPFLNPSTGPSLYGPLLGV